MSRDQGFDQGAKKSVYDREPMYRCARPIGRPGKSVLPLESKDVSENAPDAQQCDRLAFAAQAPAIGLAAGVSQRASAAMDTPKARSEAALRMLIDNLQKGITDLSRTMLPSLQISLDRQVGLVAGLAARLQSEGALTSVSFVGLERGLEVYHVRFENVAMGWALALNTEGKLTSLCWRFQ
jgi:hypothetical protein